MQRAWFFIRIIIGTSFNFDFIFKARLWICYFFFSLLWARKKRKRSNPEKEKSRARLEFVGILKQERRKHFYVVLASKFHNSMPKIRSLSGSPSPKGRYKPKACCIKSVHRVFRDEKHAHVFFAPRFFCAKRNGAKAKIISKYNNFRSTDNNSYGKSIPPIKKYRL